MHKIGMRHEEQISVAGQSSAASQGKYPAEPFTPRSSNLKQLVWRAESVGQACLGPLNSSGQGVLQSGRCDRVALFCVNKA